MSLKDIKFAGRLNRESNEVLENRAEKIRLKYAMNEEDYKELTMVLAMKTSREVMNKLGVKL